jgi:hypothetical protein
MSPRTDSESRTTSASLDMRVAVANACRLAAPSSANRRTRDALPLYPRRMSRAQASPYLLAIHDIQIAAATLLKLAWKGGGPRFYKDGNARVLYAQEDLDEWAAKRLSKPLESTADFKSQTANS